MTIAALLTDLRAEYLSAHTRKEDLFWETKMGLSTNVEAAQHAMSDAEVALNTLLQDPARLKKLREVEARGEGTAEEKKILEGWIRLFQANTIEDENARALSRDIVQAENALAIARGGMQLGFNDPKTGQFERASTNKLALLIANDPDAATRKAAHAGLRSVENFVLDHGFLEIVKMRNRLGRMLGYEDYYDWKVTMAERMSKREVFARLDDLMARTKARADGSLAAFAKQHGEDALEPYNFLYLRAGETAKELNPYFPFAESLRRWATSFAALGVKYRGAKLTLDLVDREGKYENGFMHGPGPAFFDGDTWLPARINFTANAVPGSVGSGLSASETLFHEGGHAAHFANIISKAPCFSIEFAPTSVAYAETQSMFMDSLISDPDWRARYAKDTAGNAIPFSLMEKSIREKQPFRAWDVRRLVTVPFGERRIYELPENELRADRVLEELRAIEKDSQGLTSAARPILAVPHLLAGESSAYYHAYTLAEMGVYQTRAFFQQRDGYLADNPKIGPDLTRAYWSPGNQQTFNETLVALTGKELSADALVAHCNRTVDEAVNEAKALVAAADKRAPFTGKVNLDAHIRVMHGNELITTIEGDNFEEACNAFASWIHSLESKANN